MAGDGESILRVALHAQMERLYPCRIRKALKGESARASIAQSLHSSFEYERQWAECLGVRKSVIGGIGIGELLEAAGSGPVELAGINDNAADCGAVTAEELGC